MDSSENTEPLSSSKGRLTTIATNRADYWSVALGEFGDRTRSEAAAAGLVQRGLAA